MPPKYQYVVIFITFSKRHRSLFSSTLSRFGLSEVCSLVSFHSPEQGCLKSNNVLSKNIITVMMHLYSSNTHNSMNIQTVKSSPPSRIIPPIPLEEQSFNKECLEAKRIRDSTFWALIFLFLWLQLFLLEWGFWRLSNPT